MNVLIWYESSLVLSNVKRKKSSTPMERYPLKSIKSFFPIEIECNQIFFFCNGLSLNEKYASHLGGGGIWQLAVRHCMIYSCNIRFLTWFDIVYFSIRTALMTLHISVNCFNQYCWFIHIL